MVVVVRVARGRPRLGSLRMSCMRGMMQTHDHVPRLHAPTPPHLFVLPRATGAGVGVVVVAVLATAPAAQQGPRAYNVEGMRVVVMMWRIIMRRMVRGTRRCLVVVGHRERTGTTTSRRRQRCRCLHGETYARRVARRSSPNLRWHGALTRHSQLQHSNSNSNSNQGHSHLGSSQCEGCVPVRGMVR